MPLHEYRAKRDFERTSEPAGKTRKRRRRGEPRFVIQKHDASQLHFDLRLEMEGVMRSWAVPKGPSVDPRVRRLAMEVEDHPIEYNDFEGTIPAGEYGGGTVMLWDRGTYTPDKARSGETPEEAVLRGYREGKLEFTFNGERLQGSYALVRTDDVEGGPRSKWLLMKRKDAEADPKRDITEEVITSVATGRTMEEIAAGEGGKRVWHSNRSRPKPKSPRKPKAAAQPDLSSLQPMLARSSDRVPGGEGWVFEPKYDGIRVLALATAGSVALVTRNGLDKARQFPEVVEALAKLVEDTGDPVVLDGEIVALEKGKIARFESLQGRMHVQDDAKVRRYSKSTPAALVAFDLLLRGNETFLEEEWEERRERLEELLENRTSDTLRISEVTGDHQSLIQRAKREGWEGVIAKRRSSRYRPGQRTHDWLKLKIENRQEFVVGGWTEPRKTRSYLGAILLGHYDDEGNLIYAGHTGTGFNAESLKQMYQALEPLERKTSPFKERPKTNERAHWTAPEIVVEVKFNEWTREGRLRQPVFVGIREDKEPRDVVREPAAAEGELLEEKSNPSSRGARSEGRATKAKGSSDDDEGKSGPVKAKKASATKTKKATTSGTATKEAKSKGNEERKGAATDGGSKSGSGGSSKVKGRAAGAEGGAAGAEGGAAEAEERDAKEEKAKEAKKPPAKATKSTNEKSAAGKGSSRGKSGSAAAGKGPSRTGHESALIKRLKEIAAAGGEGQLIIPGEGKIPLTSLGKVFYPETGHTKLDLLVYYTRMADYILPWMEDRPLVLKRFPNGVEGESFYQQAAPDPAPEGVRVETVRIEGKRQRRLVGGNLTTLLYTIQLGAISFDPWHSRVGALDSADYTVLDLDPGPGVEFQQVVEVARHVKEEMDGLGLHGGVKTSGSSGLHIYLPLPERTPLDAATLVAQIIATRVARRFPKIATVERMTKKRPEGTVYVDYLQNILGKTVAGVYAVRAKPRPTISTPLAWEELTDDLDLHEFTIDSVPGRVKKVGDLWKEPMSRPNSLDGFTKGKGK